MSAEITKASLEGTATYVFAGVFITAVVGAPLLVAVLASLGDRKLEPDTKRDFRLAFGDPRPLSSASLADFLAASTQPHVPASILSTLRSPSTASPTSGPRTPSAPPPSSAEASTKQAPPSSGSASTKRFGTTKVSAGSSGKPSSAAATRKR